jgi:hypothetical protein
LCRRKSFSRRRKVPSLVPRSFRFVLVRRIYIGNAMSDAASKAEQESLLGFFAGRPRFLKPVVEIQFARKPLTKITCGGDGTLRRPSGAHVGYEASS